MKKKIGRTSWIPTILFLIYGLIVFILLYVTIVSSLRARLKLPPICSACLSNGGLKTMLELLKTSISYLHA